MRNRLRKLTFFLLSLTLMMSVLLVEGTKAAATEDVQRAGTITGRIMIKGGGVLSNGYVVFYEAARDLPPSEKYERTPDYVRPLDAEGRFSAELPAGRYYIRAVKRRSGERIGPPVDGDYIFRSIDEAGSPKEYLVEAGKVLDIGEAGAAVVMKEGENRKQTVLTAIKGVIRDSAGKPVPDAVVVAFREQAAQSKPLFASEKTGKDGRYLLRVVAGTYYLRARTGFSSGPPETGQIVGYYGAAEPTPVTVKEGEIRSGVNFGVLLFPGRGNLSGTVPRVNR